MPGLGTTVTLYLPRRLSDAPSIAAPSAAVTIAAAPLTGLDILVVEEDPRVLAASIGALEELGHHPIGCGDPVQADELIRAHGALDLVISDVLMPGITGPEMIAALTPVYPHLAVLFVTGYAGEAGADGLAGHVVLRKPFTIAALDRAVREAMAIERPAAPHRIAAE